MNTNGIGITGNYSEALIKDIVALNYKTASVFEKYGIDFCCKGNRQLKDACNDKAINLDYVLADLENLEGVSSADNNRYNLWELDYLIQYIVNNHHKYVLSSAPVIAAHTDKIASVHGKKHPYLEEVARLFNEVANELLSHMYKEEKMLFPLIVNILEIKRTGGSLKDMSLSVSMPISVMEREHSSAGEALERIREITNNFSLPEDACNTFAVTYKELDEFEKDLHRHVFLENSILFPKAIEMETSLK